MTAFIVTLVVIANVLGSAMAYPQAAKLIRTGNAAGVSGIWAGVSIAMNLWWLSYGVANSLWGLVPTSGIAALLYALIAAAYVRSIGRRPALGLLVCGLSLGLAPLPVLLLGGWHLAGLAIGLCYGLQLAPAVIASCRTRELSGVAPGTWVMAWTEAAIWLIYGVVVLDAAPLAGGVSGLLMASIILARLAVTGHRPFRLARAVRLPA